MFSDPSINRRGFVATAAATACATGLGGASVASASSPAPGTLYDLACSDFAALIGTSFHVAGSDDQEAPVEAQLVLRQVTSCAHPTDKLRPSHIRPEGFSLMFDAPSEVRLGEGMHLVAGGNLPPCQLTLDSRVDPRYPHRRLYEAVFN